MRNPRNPRSQFSRRAAAVAGTGKCTLCSCDGYADDGSGFSRCKCGDRKQDHLAQDDAEARARRAESRRTVPA